jgi:membrane fusion protein, multidrug efflux system
MKRIMLLTKRKEMTYAMSRGMALMVALVMALKMVRMMTRSIIKGVAVSMIIATITACSKDTEEVSAPHLRPVRIIVVSNNGAVRERTFSGVSRSTQESRMSFKVSGTVIELPVQVGDQLKQGDLIAGLNRSSYELQAEQAEASLEQARANKRNTDASYRRVKELYGNTNASKNDLDAARANAESAGAQVRSASKSLEIAQLNRSYTRLTAATDCTVASVDVDLNENVSAGGQIAKVNCGAGIEVNVGIPESLIAQFEQGMPAIVRFNAIPNKEYTGKVTEVGIASGGSSATYPIVIVLDDYDRAVRPSMAAGVTFAFASQQSSAHVIPASAVINDERGVFVFLADPAANDTATIRRQAVETGELTAKGIEIIAGLKEGDRVVTAGTSIIREQQTVLLPRG